MFEIKSFGYISTGEEAHLYTLSSKNGSSVTMTDYGARIVSVMVPDSHGIIADVALGYDTVQEYESNNGYFGAVVGRCANRLRDAHFILNGTEHKLVANNMDVNTLHGGLRGFDKRIWKAEIGEGFVRFTYRSLDGEEGFPGNLDVCVEYRFSDNNELVLSYSAVCDKDTVVNLTNHVYWNLNGHNGISADNQDLFINADFYTPVNKYSQLTGEILHVKGTVFDFTKSHRIGLLIDNCHPQIRIGKGYDHNFVLRKSERGAMELCAILKGTGRQMEIYTTQPGVQFYSGNNISQRAGKNGATYTKWQGICLETHCFPDAMWNTHFPSPVLKAGQELKQITKYCFS